jgi:5,10-methylenetetrahydromethanopterin reductase
VWPILTLVAEHTKRVLVGPDVTHPFARHAVVTASNIAALDELSEGRAILGVGQGSFFEPANVPHERPIAAVRELIESVRHLLRGELGGYRGEVFQVAAGAALRFPAARKDIPVFLGAYGPQMIWALAPLVDEVRPPAQWATEYLDVVKQAMAGSQAELAVDIWPFASHDRPAAEAMARRHIENFLPYVQPMAAYYGMRDLDDAVRLFCAVGDEAELAEGCRRLFEAGARRITFSGPLGPDWAEALKILARVASIAV